jgi:hypothetical protein
MVSSKMPYEIDQTFRISGRLSAGEPGRSCVYRRGLDQISARKHSDKRGEISNGG